MDFKNTLLLLLTLAVLGLGLYFVRSRPAPTTAKSPESAKPATAAATQDVLEGEVGDIDKIVVKRRDEPEWVFEKKADDGEDTPSWHMTAPLQFKAVSWEVEKFPQQLKGLRYDISYKPGEAGITLDSAGLKPPHAVVTLYDADGKSTGLEIGGPAGKSETYVRPVDGDRICVGKSSLTGLFKNKPIEYRDKQLWTFDAKDAVKLEVTDRSAPGGETSYVFAREGSRWMIESPFTARATSKVDDAVKALSRLRVIQWQDDDASRLGVYGLESPALTERVTVQEEVKVKPDKKPDADKDAKNAKDAADSNGKSKDKADADAKEAAAPKTETRMRTFEIRLSDRSPIGEDTKVYASAGDAPAVATVMKTTVDKLRPKLGEWRDMHVTPVDTTAATSFSLEVPGGRFEAQKTGTQWRRTADDVALDGAAVKELLSAVRDLTAAAFVADDAKVSFDDPQAVVRMEVPGVEGGEQITVGPYTDAATRLLVYVRRGTAGSVAKVRSSDIAPLLRQPVAYLDRTVLNLVSSGISAVSIESSNPLTSKPQTLRFQREGEAWAMTSPMRSKLRDGAMKKLVTTLSSLRATRVVAESDQRTAFGLDSPDIQVTLDYAKPGAPGAPDGADDADDAKKTTQSIVLAVASHDGQYFAKRASDAMIFEVDKTLFDQLGQEYLPDNVWTFKQEDVTGFSVMTPEITHGFDRKDNKWVYRGEPDLPLDTKSVEDLLLRLRDLKTAGYVDYAHATPDTFGLDNPAMTVTVELAHQPSMTLVIAQASELPQRPLGMVLGRPGVVALEKNVEQRCRVDLGSLEARG